jgi:hypothetical protein
MCYLKVKFQLLRRKGIRNNDANSYLYKRKNKINHNEKPLDFFFYDVIETSFAFSKLKKKASFVNNNQTFLNFVLVL